MKVLLSLVDTTGTHCVRYQRESENGIIIHVRSRLRSVLSLQTVRREARVVSYNMCVGSIYTVYRNTVNLYR